MKPLLSHVSLFLVTTKVMTIISDHSQAYSSVKNPEGEELRSKVCFSSGVVLNQK